MPEANGFGSAGTDSGDSDSFSQNSIPSLREFPGRIEIPPYGLGKGLVYMRTRASYEEHMAKFIGQQIRFGMAQVSRPLTQQETDCFVDQAINLSVKPRVGFCLGFLAGSVLLFRPYFKDFRKLSADIRVGLQGRLLWRLFIPVLCTDGGYEIGKVVGVVQSARNTASDPRLTQFRQDRGQDVEEIRKRILNAGLGRSPHPRPQRAPAPQTTSNQDDASPTAGFESNNYGDSMYSSGQYGSSNDNDVLPSRDSQIMAQVNSQQWGTSRPQQENRWGAPRQGHSGSRSDSQDVFDLDSPASEAPTPVTRPRSSGSAWDRLRRSPPSSPTPASNPQKDPFYDSSPADTPSTSSSTSSGSSWDRIRSSSGFPSTPFQTQSEQWPQAQQDSHDESTQRAKDKAQREFDSLLEKERQNPGDGDGYNRDKGTWGKW
ncbi:hypothetical protein AJ79_02983 [Helicocarpus griseus UAMH5409]|uniref:Uncharacterized protein n=1 Tax=Helicocarpus griseus UAMH5409 TaxID=1447875 RepID=A0A2B7XZN6_9EURO|nr:hypothetical protein AJ79_02983 [Helicocarpus griseus UAMH5409]